MTLRRAAQRWLFWLALILPIAQAMAGAHALTHVGEAQQDGIVHLVDCELCLAAAQLAGSAPAAEPPAPPAAAAGDTLVTLRPVPAIDGDAAWLPPARAPPLSA